MKLNRFLKSWKNSGFIQKLDNFSVSNQVPFLYFPKKLRSNADGVQCIFVGIFPTSTDLMDIMALWAESKMTACECSPFSTSPSLSFNRLKIRAH